MSTETMLWRSNKMTTLITRPGKIPGLMPSFVEEVGDALAEAVVLDIVETEGVLSTDDVLETVP